MSKNNAWDDDRSSHKEGKLLTPDTSNLIVKIIEDDTTHLHESLGISRTETKRLQDKLHELLKIESEKKQGQKNLSQLIVELSKECVHANQLAFICFALGRSTGQRGDDRSESSIAGAIGINRKTGEIKHFREGDDDLPDFIQDILRDILKGKKGGKNDDRD